MINDAKAQTAIKLGSTNRLRLTLSEQSLMEELGLSLSMSTFKLKTVPTDDNFRYSGVLQLVSQARNFFALGTHRHVSTALFYKW